MDRVVADYLESPSEVPAEFGHHLSCLTHPSSHHGIDESDAHAVGIRNLVEVKEGFRSPLVHGHRSCSRLARPRYRRDWGCTAHTQ